MNYQTQIAKSLLEIKAVGFAPNKPITFKSGIKSPIYIDNRKFPFYPIHWQYVIKGFKNIIEENEINFDVLAGIATGGIPHSAALGLLTQKPSIYIRKETKDHGTKKLTEGGDVKNKKVLLVEDLVTTGGSSLKGIKSLRQENAIVSDCLVIISYGFSQSKEAFKKAKVKLHSLTNFDTILKLAFSKKIFNQKEYNLIKDWFINPRNWAQRNNL